MNIASEGIKTVTAEIVGAEYHPTHRVCHVRLMNGYRLDTTVTADAAIATLWATDASNGVVGVDIRPRPVPNAAAVAVPGLPRPFSDAAVRVLSTLLPLNAAADAAVRVPTTSLLTLCVDRKYLVFLHTPGVPLPPALVNFVTHPGNTLVGANVRNHLRLLELDFGLTVNGARNAVDIMELAGEGYAPRDRYGVAGSQALDDLTKFMVEAPGEESMMGRWNTLPLSDAQIQTLTIHAVLGFDIGSFINAPNLRRRRNP